MSDLNTRLATLARTTPRDPLLSMRVALTELQAFTNTASDLAPFPTLHDAGLCDADGSPTEAGEWVRKVTSGDEAVVLTLRFQNRTSNSELQMWLDEDLALLIDLRATGGEQHPHVLLGYASYLDLPNVMARWFGIGPADPAPAAPLPVDRAQLTALTEQEAPAGLGSLSAGNVPLVDFAYDGERYRIFVDAEGPQGGGVQLESITSWNLLLLLAAAVTSPPPTLEV